MATLSPNAQRLLRLLIAEGPAYRADLARTLDVSRATVTNLTNRLTADGWLEETIHDPGALKNLIGTTPRLGVLVSVLFLVDACTVAISTLDGRLLKEFTLQAPVGVMPRERLDLGADLVEQLMVDLELDRSSVRALHLAVDTQMDARTGDVYAQRASSRWYGVNPKQHFVERFGVPVHTQNTARLEGLAEHLWGAGREHRDMLYVEVSYGVTAGHVIDGIIRSGARGGSGELGHTIYDWNGPVCTCGNTGCLMQYASIPAMLRDFRTAVGDTEGWAEFAAAVRDGDEAAVAIVRRAADVLGRMLVNTCHLIDPEVLVLSGEVVRDLPSFAGDVAAVIAERALPLVGRHVEVVSALLEDTYGATARAGIDSLRAIPELVTEAISL